MSRSTVVGLAVLVGLGIGFSRRNNAGEAVKGGWPGRSGVVPLTFILQVTQCGKAGWGMPLRGAFVC